MIKQKLLTGIVAATLAISGICPVSYAAETAEPAGEESTIQAEEVTAIDKGTISTYDSSDFKGKLIWTLYSDGNLVISGDDGACVKDVSYKPMIDISKESSSKVKKITSNTLVYLNGCYALNLTGMENLEEINLPFFVSPSSETMGTILAYSSSLKKVNMPKAHIQTDNYYNKQSSLHIEGATVYNKGYGLLGDISSLEYICFSNEGYYDNYWDYTLMQKDNGYCWVDSNGDEVQRASLQFSDYTGLVYNAGGEFLNNTKYPISVGKKKYNIDYDIIKYEYSEAGSYYYADGKVVLYDPKREALYTGGVRVDGFNMRRNSETYTIGTDLTLEPQAIDGYTLFTSYNNVIKPEDYGDRTVIFEYISNDTLKMLEPTTEEPTTEEPTTEEPIIEEPTTEEPTTEEPTTEEPTTEEPTTEEPVIDEPVVTPTYKLSYNANGGTVSKTSKVLKEDAKYGTLPTAKKSGYSFLGWYTARSGGTKVSALTRMAGKDKTIYAHWKKITVKQEQIKSAERAKNKLSATVRYTKDYSADGYRIQYSTSPTFSKAVTRYVTGNKTTSYKITNLNKSKTYYVRVAAYKYDSAGKKVYGKNSSRKTIK